MALVCRRFLTNLVYLDLTIIVIYRIFISVAAILHKGPFFIS